MVVGLDLFRRTRGLGGDNEVQYPHRLVQPVIQLLREATAYHRHSSEKAGAEKFRVGYKLA